MPEGTEGAPRGHTHDHTYRPEYRLQTNSRRCRKGPGGHQEDTPIDDTYRPEYELQTDSRRVFVNPRLGIMILKAKGGTFTSPTGPPVQGGTPTQEIKSSACY